MLNILRPDTVFVSLNATADGAFGQVNYAHMHSLRPLIS